jgi:L-ribulose-5-phosphate 3-epimerase
MTSSKLTRRQWMMGSAMAGAGVWCRPSSGSLAAAGSAGGFRIGACDWTLGFRADPKSFEMAAKLGLDGVQVDLGDPAAGLPVLKSDVQRTILEASKKNKVAIGSLAMGALNEVPYKSDPRAERWVAESVDACQALGVHVILLAFFGDGDLRDDAKGVDAVVQRLKQVMPKAEKAGVVFGFESWLNAKQHLDILDRVGSPALQVYYDVANSHKEGHDIYRDIRMLGKRICEFHAKDYDDLYGKGSINFPEVRRAMDDIGYRGWIHMEGVQMPLGIEESLRYDLGYLRSVFPAKV